MKKFLFVFLSLISVICLSFAFVGCGDGQSSEDEPEGKLYRLAAAIDEGWIDEFDLKSIACGYYEWLNIEANPYSGLYEKPTEQLSEEIQNKIKQAYFGRIDGITIPKYYGTYDGNIVVTLGFEDVNYDELEGQDIAIDGIIFPELDLYPIRVYHCPEQKDPSLNVTGKLYNVKAACESELLNEKDLKSISCYNYDLYEDLENPYSGLYEPPTQKLSRETKQELKQAYLEQIDEYPDGELDGVKICKYIGEYNGNAVVVMFGYSCRIADYSTDEEIGGVTFCRGSWINTFVYKK